MSNPLAGLFDQFENFLFDLLGIVLPGFIFLMLLLTPVLLTSLPPSIIEFQDTPIAHFVGEISKWVNKQPIANSFYGLLLLSFVLGHVRKYFYNVAQNK